MHLKRTVSIIIAALMVVSAIYVTPFSAVEGEVDAQEMTTVADSTFTEGTTAESETQAEASEAETTETKATEPSTKPKATEPEPTEAPAKKTKTGKTSAIKVKGTTIQYYNKKVLNSINSYRKSKGLKKFTNDTAMSSKANKRAAMLSVYYSGKLSAKADNLPKKCVIAKGATYLNVYKKYKAKSYAKDKTLNACGIANLKVGSERFWVIYLGEKTPEKINKVTTYSKKVKNYSASGDYYVKYFKAKGNTGGFKNKSVRFVKDKKYSGQLYFKNYKTSVNSFFKVDNEDKHTPVKYSTKNSKIAEVTPYGNVKGKRYSAFKDRTRYTPKKGDFILFHWYKNDGFLANHVGVVYKVTDNSITTIEGNTKSYNYRKSVVSKRIYKNYKNNSLIVGFIDLSEYMSRENAIGIAKLAKKQIGKRGHNYYNHTKAWKDFIGKYEAAHWCSIFCGWLLEQKGYDPYDVIRWNPGCSNWIKWCHKRATAKIKAKVAGSKKTYSYNITFKI